jgi:hypothetical protein
MTRRYVLAFVSPAASLALIVNLALVLPEPDGPRSTRRTSGTQS